MLTHTHTQSRTKTHKNTQSHEGQEPRNQQNILRCSQVADSFHENRKSELDLQFPSDAISLKVLHLIAESNLHFKHFKAITIKGQNAPLGFKNIVT